MKIKLVILVIAAVALFSFTAIQVERANKKDTHSSNNSKPSEGFALEDRDQWK
jgi:hypothetical protein